MKHKNCNHSRHVLILEEGISQKKLIIGNLTYITGILSQEIGTKFLTQDKTSLNKLLTGKTKQL